MKAVLHSNNLHCELRAEELRTNSRTADNIRLKEILKRRALFGNQTVVLLTNSCGCSEMGGSLWTEIVIYFVCSQFFLVHVT